MLSAACTASIADIHKRFTHLALVYYEMASWLGLWFWAGTLPCTSIESIQEKENELAVMLLANQEHRCFPSYPRTVVNESTAKWNSSAPPHPQHNSSTFLFSCIIISHNPSLVVLWVIKTLFMLLEIISQSSCCWVWNQVPRLAVKERGGGWQTPPLLWK